MHGLASQTDPLKGTAAGRLTAQSEGQQQWGRMWEQHEGSQKRESLDVCRGAETSAGVVRNHPRHHVSMMLDWQQLQPRCKEVLIRFVTGSRCLDHPLMQVVWQF